MKHALLVASFGTTHLDALARDIAAVETAIRCTFPSIPCFRAFTSPTVRRRLRERDGMEIDSVEEALRRLEHAGFTHVTVQPTLLLPGEEYEKLREDILRHKGELSVAVGKPLLYGEEDAAFLAQTLAEIYPQAEDTVLLAMGHGTAHAADTVYATLRREMNERGMELCTVEGSLDFAHAVAALRAGGRRKVRLLPLLLVAGAHSLKDMAGSDPGSLQSVLTAEGFSVECILRGLGELESVQQLFCRRVAEALN